MTGVHACARRCVRVFIVCVVIGGLSLVPTGLSVAAESSPAASAATPFRVTTFDDLDDVMWRINSPATTKEIAAIEEAAPSVAPAKPARPRKVLVYGRNETHSGPVQRGFVAMEALGRKSGGFEAVWTGDPAAFLPDNLRQFDVVVMNNTHDNAPMLPRGFKDLDEAAQAQAREREAVCKKSLLEFVAGGKGLVGIHAATIAGQWPEYLEMIGGQYGSCYPVDYKADKSRVRVEDPGHPLCAGLDPAGFPIKDEVYMFGPPFFSRSKVRVLLSFDIGQVPDAKVLGLKDKLFASTWVKKHGEGRVFYSSMGHMIGAFTSPQVMRCWLAGIQFAAGDLPVDVTPLGEP